jgi:hypothetical protein
MVDDGGKVGGAVQLDLGQSVLVRLQYAAHTSTVGVAGVEILQEISPNYTHTVKSGYSDSHRDQFFVSLYPDFTVSGRPVIVIFL